MSYYSWRAIAGGWGMSNSKNDDRTSLRLLKATANTVWGIQDTRSWETRVYLQSLNKQPLPVAVVLLAITPIPSRYVDWVTLSPLIMSTHWKAFSAWWCKWVPAIHVSRLCKQSSICLFKKESESTPIVFLERGTTKHSVFHWFWLKPTSCYGHTQDTAPAW